MVKFKNKMTNFYDYLHAQSIGYDIIQLPDDDDGSEMWLKRCLRTQLVLTFGIAPLDDNFRRRSGGNARLVKNVVNIAYSVSGSRLTVGPC